jgi:hypothetical protein
MRRGRVVIDQREYCHEQEIPLKAKLASDVQSGTAATSAQAALSPSRAKSSPESGDLSILGAAPAHDRRSTAKRTSLKPHEWRL